MDDTERARTLLPQADFLIALKLPNEYVPWLAPCRLVQTFGVGYDGIDRAGLAVRDIPLATTPEWAAIGVAEHTLMLAVCRQVGPSSAQLRSGGFDKFGWRADARFVYGKTLGIVGFGRIGRRVGHLANAFDVRIIYNDLVRAPIDMESRTGASAVTLDELVAQADIVTVHVPLTDKTKGMFDADRFRAMKTGALFINTSRGPTYSIDALNDTLQSGHLAGAGLDVYAPEPPPPGHPLLQLSNVVCTPHMASGATEAQEEKTRAQFANIARVLRDKAPLNVVVETVE